MVYTFKMQFGELLYPLDFNLHSDQYSLSHYEVTLNIMCKLQIFNRYLTNIAQIQHQRPADKIARNTG